MKYCSQTHFVFQITVWFFCSMDQSSEGASFSWDFLHHSLPYTLWLFKSLRSIQGSVLLFCPLCGLQCPKNQSCLQLKNWIIFPFCPSYQTVRGTRQPDFVQVHFTLKTSLLGQPIITVHLGHYLLVILTKRKTYRTLF